MTFVEYIARLPGVRLPDGETLLRMIGGSPTGPHEIDVMRMAKQWKRQAAMTPKDSGRYPLSSPRKMSQPARRAGKSSPVADPVEPFGGDRRLTAGR